MEIRQRMMPARVWVTSDIHIDYQENFDRVLNFANEGHYSDALIIAGDATDKLERLRALLEGVRPNFNKVLFIPGNHELWVRRSTQTNSLEKFYAIQALCRELGVDTAPVLFGHREKVWLFPLYSWYDDKDNPDHSLYLEKSYAEDLTDSMWGDFTHARWPFDLDQPLAQLFADENEKHLGKNYEEPIISFSHFLPRVELIFNGPMKAAMRLARWFDPVPEFNFSRVAGSTRIEEQIRRLGSKLHIYGHQHVNRVRTLENITYLSHCLGYPRERQRGRIRENALLPRCVWRDDIGFCDLSSQASGSR